MWGENLHIQIILLKLEIQIQGFISSWFDYTLPHCPVVSAIKLLHSQVIKTATGLPTGTRGRNHIIPISALLHRLPRIDLLIAYKPAHVLSPDTFHFFVHVLMNIALLPSPRILILTNWGQKESELLLSETMKSIYHLLYDRFILFF